MMPRRAVSAYAKINLGLRILGKRADGYHDIETDFLQIDLADKLFFETTSSARFEMECNRPEIPCDHTNLCARAYERLSAYLGWRRGLRLRLQKGIPAGAGLGGGSSDAAVTLVTLNNLWEAGLSRSELYRLALQLGSDVPFFLEGGLCRATGRGEIITPLAELPGFWVLVVTPDIRISTAWVYDKVKIGLTNSQKNSIFFSLAPYFEKTTELTSIHENDLESVVFDEFPELETIKRKLIEAGALFANMTGSGSAIYGLYGSPEEARNAQRSIEPQYKTYIARPIKWGKREIDQYYSSTSGW